MHCLFLEVPDISLLFPAALKYDNSSYFCSQKRAMIRKTDKGIVNTNKTELQTKQ